MKGVESQMERGWRGERQHVIKRIDDVEENAF
jgi:hypothetical protein